MRNLLFAGIVLAVAACSNQKIEETVQLPEEKDPKYNVQFSSISPSENDTIKAGESILLKADVSSQFYMHGYQVSLVEAYTGDTLFQIGQHVHDTLYQIEEEWVNTLEKNTLAEVSFKITIDHQYNYVKKAFMCVLKANE